MFNDKVVIGFGGGDFGAVRGYVTAYDADTGKQLWRWWTVPGDPAKGFENKAMEMAAKTWTGEWWKYGGGGTVWNAMTYDPEFNRAVPRHRQRRAVELEDPQPGRRRQPVPVLGGGAERGHRRVRLALPDHARRRVGLQLRDGHDAGHAEHRRRAAQGLLHAPKNGFFYVIDRENGKLISAEKLGKVTWADARWIWRPAARCSRRTRATKTDR